MRTPETAGLRSCPGAPLEVVSGRRPAAGRVAHVEDAAGDEGVLQRLAGRPAGLGAEVQHSQQKVHQCLPQRLLTLHLPSAPTSMFGAAGSAGAAPEHMCRWRPLQKATS